MKQENEQFVKVGFLVMTSPDQKSHSDVWLYLKRAEMNAVGITKSEDAMFKKISSLFMRQYEMRQRELAKEKMA